MSNPVHAHSSEAESYLIGAMLTDTNIRNALAGDLRPEDFYSEQHRRIFIAVLDYNLNGSSLSGFISPRELDVEADDAKYVSRIITSSPPVGQWKKAKERVKNLSLARKHAAITSDIARTLAQEPSESALETLSRNIGMLEELLTGGISQGAQHLSSALPEWREYLEEIQTRKGIPGAPTSIGKIDRFLGGLQKDRNIILGARSGHGKTTLATTIARNVALLWKYKIFVQSTEMTRVQYLGMIARSFAYVTDMEIQEGNIPDHKKRRLAEIEDKIEELPIYIDDNPGATPDIMRRNIARLRPDVVIVDYLQRMKLPRDLQGRSQYENVSTLSLEVDRLKGIYKTSLLTVVQLNRKAEDRDDGRPGIGDIRDSGQIEQDANAVLLLHRPIKYKPDARPNESILECPKNRHGEEDWASKLYKYEGIPYLTDDPKMGVGLGG